MLLSPSYYGDIQRWINAGNDINLRVQGLPLLSLLCEEQNEQNALALIDAGCDVNATDFITGDTPMHYAVFYYPSVVKALISRDANVHQLNRENQSPLVDANNFLCDPDPHASTPKIVESSMILIQHGCEMTLDSNMYLASEIRDAVVNEITKCDTARVCLQKQGVTMV